MHILNINIVKKLINYSLNKGYVEWLPRFYKYFPSNWKDDKGNNFYHFAAKHHNKELFEIAVQNNANINEVDNNGNAPIHRFIESCFIIEDEKVIFDFDEHVLNLFIHGGANINQWIDYDKRNEKEEDKTYIFSRNNILGSPMELLISIFWDKMLIVNEEIKEEYINRYNKLYNILSENGANINFMKNGNIFYDIENEKTIDAMQVGKSIILSHFFIQYFRTNYDLPIIKAFMNDPRLDFSLKDDQDNTVLHNFFARITRRYENLDPVKIQDILFTIYNNPSFKIEDLHIKNSFGLEAIGCLKKEALEYKKFLEILILQRKLDKDLNKNIEKSSIKRMKI